MKTVLFQGDSITDAGRNRNNPNDLGTGYPQLVAAKVGFKYPNEYKFVNEGISGNRVANLYARLQSDFVDIAPDYLSILIGINDVWHGIAEDANISTKRFEDIYAILLEDLKEKLPNTKIALLEPFVLKGTATEENWHKFLPQTKEKAEVTKKLCEKFDLIFVPLQDEFDKASEKAPTSFWLSDGVHPTPAGHELIANEWIKAFNL